MKKLFIYLSLFSILSCEKVDQTNPTHNIFDQNIAKNGIAQWTGQTANNISETIENIDFTNTQFKLKASDILNLYKSSGNLKFYPALNENDGNFEFYCLAQKGDGDFYPLYAEPIDETVSPLKIRTQEFENTGFLTQEMSAILKERLNSVAREKFIELFNDEESNDRVELFEMFEKDYPSIIVGDQIYLGAYDQPESITEFSIQFGLHEKGEENLEGTEYKIQITTILKLSREDISTKSRTANLSSTQSNYLEYDFANPCPPCNAGIQ
ncbi:hypothetical protein [Persicobacter sp. CCB-QB2]|uniref:hypothetical protein n=1 Tax=Persicobacter sp. CCB-QB2 TaxID=1561025 RepID=UPI0006A9C194|nr:hypothetical protein [Persicobacter sp. CCB-QB2]